MTAIKIICTFSSFKPNKESNILHWHFSIKKKVMTILEGIPIERNY
jgi:hypothetical protein